MDLGSGEYLIISNCIKMPYSTLKLTEFLKSIEIEIEIIERIVYFDSEADCINYNIVWEGLETLSKDSFDYNDVSRFPLSSLDVKFIDGMVGRIQITFLDEFSYEVSFITNYTEEFEECHVKELKITNAEKVEQLALKMFKYLKPVYGYIGVEISSEGLAELKSDKTLLPLEKVFVSDEVSDSDIQAKVDEFKYCKTLENGIYLRNSEVDDYLFELNIDARNMIIGDSTFFERQC